MGRVGEALRVRQGEGRTVALTVGTMAVASAGFAIGQSGIDGLFFSRYGVQNLPILYLIQGPLMFAASLGATGALARLDRRRAFTLAPLGLAALLLLERVAAATGVSIILPALWLSVSVALLVQSLFTWGIAGLVTDTRQAKRLFPLFGAGTIAGAVLGGLVTKPLAAAIGAPNLLLVWAALLVASAALGAAVVPRRWARLRGARRRAVRRSSARPLQEVLRGLEQARRSALVASLAAAAVCFSVLYYSVYLPFSAAAAARYPSAEALAGFFGVFSAVTTGAALLISVVIANRLLSRIGVAAVVALLALVYVVGFGALIATEAFAVIVAFRFAQMVLAQGLVSPAWEALVNVVPPSRRDKTRAFLNGGPTQVGTMLAGVLQLAGEHALTPSTVAAIGLGVAVLTVVLSIRVRRSYTSAVVEALREGHPQVFGRQEEEPFVGLVRDPLALRSTLEAAAHADPRIRRVAVHALAEVDVPEVVEALTSATHDEDPEIRARALRGLGAAGLGRARELLHDSEGEVRLEAATVLLYDGRHSEAEAVARELLSNADPAIRARAVAAVAATGADVGDRLVDPSPTVRIAAARALVRTGEQGAVVGLLGDAVPAVRRAVAEALADAGLAEPLASALADPTLASGALLGLERLRPTEAMPAVRAYALEAARTAASDRDLAAAIEVDGDAARALLRDSLLHRGRRRAAEAFRAAAILSSPQSADAIGAALEDLGASDAAQVANALEAIESAIDRSLARPLVRLWEPIPPTSRLHGSTTLDDARNDDDPWIRACADLAATRRGGDGMDTDVRTLSAMERVLFLRDVPLFADLPPADLKHVADVAEELTFADGDAIAVEGEPGDDMHVIVAGTVRVLHRVPGAGERQLARRSTGDAVGEMAVITREPRVASLVAEGEVRTLRIGRAEFETILRERPETALAVMRVLSHRLAERSSAEEVV